MYIVSAWAAATASYTVQYVEHQYVSLPLLYWAVAFLATVGPILSMASKDREDQGPQNKIAIATAIGAFILFATFPGISHALHGWWLDWLWG